MLFIFSILYSMNIVLNHNKVALVLAGDAPTPSEEAKAEETAARAASLREEGQNNSDGESQNSSSGASSVRTSDAFDESSDSAPQVPQPVKRFRPACVLVAGAGGRDVACYALPRPPAPRTMLRPSTAGGASATDGHTAQDDSKDRNKSKSTRNSNGNDDDSCTDGEWVHPGGGQQLGGYGGHGAAVTAIAQAPWRCGASLTTIAAKLNASAVGEDSSNQSNNNGSSSVKSHSTAVGQPKSPLTTEELAALNSECNGYEWCAK